MRSIWTGTISFGLVNIPVRLYSATEQERLDLDMLHKKDLSPVRFARVCREDGHEIPYEDIVKGYQVQKGDYIVLEKEDFEKANARKTNTIDIDSFSHEDEIDSMLFEKPYYLEPGKGADKAYVLLREALRKSKKVGVARFVLKNREHVAVLKPEGDVLVLNALRFKSEIRPPDIKVPKTHTTKSQEMDIARRLIDQLTEEFKPEAYKDTYTDELKSIIAKKAKGKVPSQKGSAPKPTKVTDLMDALRKSLSREKVEA